MVHEDFISRRNAMMRKARRLVGAMTQAEANQFLVGGLEYRRTWMHLNLDGRWGQSHENLVKMMVAKKLGLLNR
jgi:hypothetical protein